MANKNGELVRLLRALSLRRRSAFDLVCQVAQKCTYLRVRSVSLVLDDLEPAI